MKENPGLFQFRVNLICVCRSLVINPQEQRGSSAREIERDWNCKKEIEKSSSTWENEIIFFAHFCCPNSPLWTGTVNNSYYAVTAIFLVCHCISLDDECIAKHWFYLTPRYHSRGRGTCRKCKDIQGQNIFFINPNSVIFAQKKSWAIVSKFHSYLYLFFNCRPPPHPPPPPPKNLQTHCHC